MGGQNMRERAGSGGADALLVLLDTVEDLTSTLSTREVVERLLGRVLLHLDSEIASILLLERDGQLAIRHAHGLPDEVKAQTRVPMGEGISGYVAQTGRSVLIEDVESDPRFERSSHERYYTNSALSAPLRIRGQVMGVINVNNKRNREPYVLAELRLVEAIAGYAAVALANAFRFEETLERARCDALTGLPNHGHFWSTLDLEMQRADRYGRTLSLAMIDVDHFKVVNDRLGHLGGDGVLTGLAELLRGRSRGHDLAARYGGEEFAIILPETDAAGAAAFAEKIRQSVEAEAFGPAAAGEVTVSIGIATYPGDADEPTRLVESADRRLYAAKAAGRNRVASGDDEKRA